jgi:hypothetical protein
VHRHRAVGAAAAHTLPATLSELTGVGEALQRATARLPRAPSALESMAGAAEEDWSSGGAVADEAAFGSNFQPAPAGDPSEVREEQDVEGVGRFRLFGNGRVSVLFEDRTILTMRDSPLRPAEARTWCGEITRLMTNH